MAERNFANRTLYHGDNLNFLRGMNSGTVDLIATDPPFNKSKDFHATPDSLAAGASFQDRWSWHDDIHDDWLTAIMRDEPEVWAVIDTAKKVYGDDMGAFLCWLGVRLLEMHRILADDGSIYLHIDHTAHAYVKALMDAVFGRENFRNEIVWCYTGPQAARRHYPRKHDIILFYSYPNATFNRDDIRIPSKWNELGGFSRPDVERQNQGKVPEDWWHMTFGPNTPERTGYPTQKPLALYERIIKASSDRGDLVLDPFCGCATTPVAAERLGRQWVGMDIWDGAHQQVLDRLEKEKLAVKGRPSRAREKVTPPRCVTHVRRYHLFHDAAKAHGRRGACYARASHSYRAGAAVSLAAHPAQQVACRYWCVLSGMRCRLHLRLAGARSRPYQPPFTGRHGCLREPHAAMPALQQGEARPLHAYRIAGP